MSWLGSATGRPSDGLRMLFDDSMRTRASSCASNESGTCTAIWSPSKSALNAAQTSGWMRMALPSTSTGSNAWMPRRWSVGARLSSTGWSRMISSRISYTSGDSRSTIFLARLTVSAIPFSTSLWMMNGLNSSSAISFGSPHWCSLSSGPTTMTERPVDRLLQHALLVARDDLRRAVRDELLQTVVAVDDAAVQVVQIRRGEPAAVQRNERPEVGRDHWNDVQDHPLRLVAHVARVSRVPERIDDLEPLEQHLLPMLRRLDDDGRAELVGRLVDVEATEQLAHRRRTDVGQERGVPFLARLRLQREELVLVEELVVLHLLRALVDDDVVRIVDHLLEITQGDVDEVPHRAREGLEEPDVRDRHGELDVAHALAAHLRQRHLDAAAIADHAAIADALVLAAMALPVLDGTEDALAEQAVLLRLERPVVDGLGLGHLAPRPPVAHAGHLQPLALLGVLGAADLFGRSDPDLDEVERRCAGVAHAAEINHDYSSLPLPAFSAVPVSIPVP